MSESHFTVEHLATKDLKRFFSKIKISTEHFYNGSPCWEWQGCRKIGYGSAMWKTKVRSVHRIMYAWLVEPLPRHTVKELDHLCRNRPCCNPAHLELVTREQHILRSQGISMVNAAKTHCATGHPFTPENIIRRKNGGRTCKTCQQGWRHQRYLKDRQKPEWVAKTQAAGREYHRRKKKAPADS